MRNNFVTYTNLPDVLSARQTFTLWQKIIIFFLIISSILGFLFSPLLTFQILVAVISLLYFADTVFNLGLTLRSIRKTYEIGTSEEKITTLNEQYLPTYTILCPLYREVHVVPQFIEAMEKIDWPKEKLDVMLLLEEDDRDTIAAVSRMQLPSFIRVVIVPDGQPKTKPKACNYGMLTARGEYLVIYDAEDIPDPLQLKKAYLAFQQVPSNVVCLQAKLNFYNSRQNLLTRFFTAEYSLWFDVTLTGLQSLNSTIPLGGTSNHFKTHVLRELEGWDPFNVTEDADLGIRLFKKGYKTAIIDSTTYEEATSKVGNWIRQRSRWIKGYMQTYLVHMRHFNSFIKEKGLWHQFIFQLTVGGKILFLLLNPLLWVITIGYFTAYAFIGPALEAIYTPPISYFAVFSWIFGNFLFFYYYMLGLAKRNQWGLIKYSFLIPVYWAMMSYAGAIALYQLLFKPHYWEKTVHGFHLSKGEEQGAKGKAFIPESVILPIPDPVFAPMPKPVYTPAIGNWQLAVDSSVTVTKAVRPAQKEIEVYSRTMHKPIRAEKQTVQPRDVVSQQPSLPQIPREILNIGFFFILLIDSVLAAIILPLAQASTYIIVSAVVKISVLLTIILFQQFRQNFSFFQANMRKI